MNDVRTIAWSGSPCLKTICILFLASVWTAAAATKAPKHQEEAVDLFSTNPVVRIQIEIPREGMQVLRRYQWWGPQRMERTDVRATVREGAHVYTNVALHLKGAAGSFRPVDDRPAMTLHFDRFAPGQRFHGLQKISLNNSVQDPTYLAEKISRELMEAAGVPVPRADHARVELNGRYLGLYVLIEGFNKQFLRRYFTNTTGNLYDGGFVKDIGQELDTNSGDNPKDHSDLEALFQAATGPGGTNRFQALSRVLDMNHFLSLVAMEVMLCHWDGYSMNKNNYRLFHDKGSDRMIFMPHGMDQMFGVIRASPSMPLFPHMEGLVARAVLGTPQGRQRYLARASELLTNVFKVSQITNRVTELAARLRPILSEQDGTTPRWHEREVRFLIQRIVQRGESLQAQLGTPEKAVRFDESGSVGLTGWKSKTDFGIPVFAQIKEPEGRRLLRVGAPNGSSVGSWRTRVALEGGRYRFEGLVKCTGVEIDPGDPRGGVGLRAANGRFIRSVTGTADFSKLSYDFEVQDAAGGIELICELRAARGEADFDLDSLRLIRRD